MGGREGGVGGGACMLGWGYSRGAYLFNGLDVSFTVLVCS